MFRVNWSIDALAHDLCQIYLDHSDRRKDITFASNQLEKRLTTSANTIGTEISSEGLYKFIYEPLQVIYTIDGTTVEIQNVRWAG